jgi:hypothetical protein
MRRGNKTARASRPSLEPSCRVILMATARGPGSRGAPFNADGYFSPYPANGVSRSGFRPCNGEIDLAASAAIIAPQERLQVADELMAGLAKPLHGDKCGARALVVDTQAVGNRQVLDASLKERAHLLSRISCPGRPALRARADPVR